MLRIYLMLFILATLSGIGYTAYSYYIYSQATIKILSENVLKLESAIKTSEEAIESLQANYAAVMEENNKINEAYSEIRRQNNRLSSKLADMDLGLLAVEKTESIERAINRGTVNAGRCFELLSGAELTEEEKNAKDGKTFNKECPWLWTPADAGGMSNNPTSSAEGSGGKQ
jgi:septal ring factor EnvC (AmiA/AmiB activator)